MTGRCWGKHPSPPLLDASSHPTSGLAVWSKRVTLDDSKLEIGISSGSIRLLQASRTSTPLETLRNKVHMLGVDQKEPPVL
jgi:hypothetical protein